jgi:hypothetical protein
MALAVITINNLSPALDKKFQEVQVIQRASTWRRALSGGPVAR